MSSTRWIVVVGLLVLLPASALAQSEEVPRTLWGDPDLQSVWDVRTITPLQRPSGLAGRATLTEEEAAAVEAQAPEAVARIWWTRSGAPLVPTTGSGGTLGPMLSRAARRR